MSHTDGFCPQLCKCQCTLSGCEDTELLDVNRMGTATKLFSFTFVLSGRVQRLALSFLDGCQQPSDWKRHRGNIDENKAKCTGYRLATRETQPQLQWAGSGLKLAGSQWAAMGWWWPPNWLAMCNARCMNARTRTAKFDEGSFPYSTRI